MKKLPVLKGKPNPCGNCPPIQSRLDLDRRIAVGFGYAALTKDGEAIWQEANHEFDDCMEVVEAERLARKDPEHDWRIVLDGPLHGETYQRQGKNLWVLVDTNQGFA